MSTVKQIRSGAGRTGAAAWRRAVVLALGSVTVALASCATPPTSAPLADWHDAVLALRDQSTAVFQGVNNLVRQGEIKRAGGMKELRKDDFVPAVTPKAVAAWNRALDALVDYSASVSTLVDPDRDADTGKAYQDLADAIGTTSKSHAFDERPGLSGALGDLATRIASQKASKDAKAIMRRADPAVRAVLDDMARMLLDDSGNETTGIAVTADAEWTVQAAALRASFLRAISRADKESIASQYVDLLDKQESTQAAILALKHSIRELAAAHGRAAAPGPGGVEKTVAYLRDQARFATKLLSDVKPASK